DADAGGVPERPEELRLDDEDRWLRGGHHSNLRTFEGMAMERRARRGRSARWRWRGARDAAQRVAASWPHAAAMSRPRVSRTVAGTPCSASTAWKAAIASRDEPS